MIREESERVHMLITHRNNMHGLIYLTHALKQKSTALKDYSMLFLKWKHLEIFKCFKIVTLSKAEQWRPI